MSVELSLTSTFEKSIKKLPPDRQKGVKSKLSLFLQNPKTNSLRYRVLEPFDDIFIINGKGGDRIILKRISDKEYEVLDVGPHDNVYRRWNRRSLAPA
ncbi:hypothetical protein PsAD46_03347 [Pseudovibrio sp. Ad46]|nr:hypothetical protein PsAD46_03347 [Pseudovibrio sp. Ad46]KZL10697.1 hypothetical protein PsAD26_03062 [Pseudovibrio sp. Ad26]